MYVCVCVCVKGGKERVREKSPCPVSPGDTDARTWNDAVVGGLCGNYKRH